MLAFNWNNESNYSKIFSTDNEKLPILQDFIKDRNKYYIKYQRYIKENDWLDAGEDGLIINPKPGIVCLNKLSTIQRRYYISTRVTPATKEELYDNTVQPGRLVIHVRGMFFLDAMLFIETPDHVLKLRESTGYLQLRIPGNEYRKMHNQTPYRF
jgi:hypothetical protein